MPPLYPEISEKIITMAQADQTMRQQAGLDPKNWDASIDHNNTQVLKEIIALIGWPTISKVGPHASHDAWLLVQHASHDPTFQKTCKQLIEQLPVTEYQPSERAYLEDRIRVHEGQPQRYGTQFFQNEKGEFQPYQIENPETVDQCRAEIGMMPIKEYTERIKEVYKSFPKPNLG